MKSFGIIAGILALIAGYGNVTAATTGHHVLTTRGEQLANMPTSTDDKQVAHIAVFNGGKQATDTSAVESNEPSLEQDEEYKALVREEIVDKIAKGLNIASRNSLEEYSYRYMVGIIGKLITCVYKCAKPLFRLKEARRYDVCLRDCSIYLGLTGLTKAHYLSEYDRIIGKNNVPIEAAEQKRPWEAH